MPQIKLFDAGNRIYQITHPDPVASYSARDVRHLLEDAGLVSAGESVEWMGSDLYQVEAARD